jgi:hypothetical protein
MVSNHTNRSGVTRRVRTAALVILLAASRLTLASPQEQAPVEYQVKAAFLLNFAKFVQWPNSVFRDEKSPITVCVFRYDPFGSVLDEMLRGKSVNNRELIARRITDFQQLPSCHLIFVSDRESRRLPEVLASVKNGSFLIVGESGSFAERGGGIQFFLEDNKLRFAVNLDALARSRLTVSSKLLALARIVHDQSLTKGS